MSISGRSIVNDTEDKLRILCKIDGEHVLKDFTPDLDFSKILVSWEKDLDGILSFLVNSPFEKISEEVKQLWNEGKLFEVETEYNPETNEFYII